MNPYPPNPPLGPHDRQDSRGRVRTFLGLGHPFANSGGWQWRSRLVVQEGVGRKLQKSEHVHHVNGNRADDRPDNLEVLACWYHGQVHAFAAAVIYTAKGVRFASPDNPESFSWPRRGAILGPAARL
jgi:hypothetical protein